MIERYLNKGFNLESQLVTIFHQKKFLTFFFNKMYHSVFVFFCFFNDRRGTGRGVRGGRVPEHLSAGYCWFSLMNLNLDRHVSGPDVTQFIFWLSPSPDICEYLFCGKLVC